MELNKKIGEKIKLARKNKKLTIAELAKLAKTSEARLSEIENGKENISILLLERLAVALGINIKIKFQQLDVIKN